MCFNIFSAVTDYVVFCHRAKSLRKKNAKTEKQNFVREKTFFLKTSDFPHFFEEKKSKLFEKNINGSMVSTTRLFDVCLMHLFFLLHRVFFTPNIFEVTSIISLHALTEMRLGNRRPSVVQLRGVGVK